MGESGLLEPTDFTKAATTRSAPFLSTVADRSE